MADFGSESFKTKKSKGKKKLAISRLFEGLLALHKE
jgi:hypothetical protein